MLRRLTELAWPAIPAQALLVVPLGSTEQHGPQLPFDTDAAVAAAVAESAAAELDAVLAPVLAYGASGEHAGFPGTLSIGEAALRMVLVELARSADWAMRIAFVNGHGGNVAALADAVRQLRTEGHDVGWVPCAAAGLDAHAGHAETSLMLRLRPDDVGPERPVGATEPVLELMPALRERGIAGVSPTGVLGDARGATATTGEALLAEMVAGVVRRVRAWRPAEHGLLRDPT
ncbi:mycofactocin biosynthesis peptidyl-dipeptidase MftE [Gryllotalpicola sp.]|uniref:mycofactocin biosynthesis peptidyl-dipeptidase MftE n=1 Tax=Gryllotalpicola sp. TaxID=1932787 RepID=UPI002607CDDE|nr:mycofactocin biosynthesis peptidyl-dipeptidase MftE [Gryllotalpicola sp.]